MATLTAADTTYFGELNLFGDELMAAIRTAELTAEGVKGARRSLSISQYTETYRINWLTQSFFVGKLPILATPTPIIKVSIVGYSDFGRSVYSLEPTALSNNQYRIDSYLGEVKLLYPQCFDTAEITYSSGFDFNVETPDTIAIKQAVANILKYQNPQALPEAQATAVSGVKQFSLNNVYSVTYADSADARYRESLLEASLLSLAKYRPREFPT